MVCNCTPHPPLSPSPFYLPPLSAHTIMKLALERPVYVCVCMCVCVYVCVFTCVCSMRMCIRACLLCVRVQVRVFCVCVYVLACVLRACVYVHASCALFWRDSKQKNSPLQFVCFECSKKKRRANFNSRKADIGLHCTWYILSHTGFPLINADLLRGATLYMMYSVILDFP